jgi:hypothetical protein
VEDLVGDKVLLDLRDCRRGCHGCDRECCLKRAEPDEADHSVSFCRLDPVKSTEAIKLEVGCGV